MVVRHVTSRLPVACKRCGECCRYLASPLKNATPDIVQWFKTTRGARIEGKAILIELPCPHLHYDAARVATCDIHDKPEYPRLCRIFDGSQKDAFYVPPRCGLRH